MSTLRTGRYVDGRAEVIDEGPSRGRINRARSSGFTGELVQGRSGGENNHGGSNRKPGFAKPQGEAA